MQIFLRASATALLIAGLFSLPSMAAEQALGQTTALNKPTIEQLFSPSQYGSVMLSPNGRYLAAVAPIGQRKALITIDLDTRKTTVVAANPEWDIVNPRWINNERLLFQVSDSKVTAADNDGGGLFAANRDGSEFRTLRKTRKQARASNEGRYGYYGYVGTVSNDSDEIYIQHDERNGDASDEDFGGSDIYRLNTKTGRKKMLTFDSPGKVNNWVLDNAGQVRIATSLRGDKKAGLIRQHVFYRLNNESPWQKLSENPYDEGLMPVGFDQDNQTLYVVTRGGEDTVGLYKWDFAKNALGELVLRHPRADFHGELIRDFDSKKVVGLNLDALKPERYYFDDEYANLQASFDAALVDADNTLQKRGDRIVVYSRSDVNPGEIFLYQNKKMESLGLLKPTLNPASLSPMQATEYTARDGLTIPAYLTLPKDREAKNLPLVMFIHGGPHARDEWGFNPTVQHLASRGYAVLQPQFRMSTGFGHNLHKKGWKQWGLTMQDDITDGVNWLVKQGTVDPKRVCIMGASYGGYATMFGLVKDPDLYQCGINYVGVTDIAMLFTVAWSDTAEGAWSKYQGVKMHGDPDNPADAAYLKNGSALENSKRITKPVMMAYGAEDIRVPLVHGEKMRDKLKAQGVPVEWIVYTGEGHGWAKPENKYDFARRYEAFLDQYIGDQAKK